MSLYWVHKAHPYRRNGYKRVERKREEAESAPPPPFGKLIETLQATDLDQSSKHFLDSAKIQNVQSVTSYSWLDGRGLDATILVPGKPPRWTPHTTPPPLREDNGQYFRDKNAARYPKHPMEPAVVASLDVDPNLPSKTEVMACGSTIDNLLRFLLGQEKTFRMLVEKVDNTVFFVRRENSPTELIPDVRGYGHSFPQAYTTWDADVMGSLNHQRIISYKFAELDLVVRFEADGYIENALIRDQTSKKSEKGTPVDDLISALSATHVSPNISSSTSSLIVTRGSSSVDHADIFDLKTRSIRKKLTDDHLAAALPRLWVTQITKFILAYHTRGIFNTEDIQVMDVKGNISGWEKENSDHLARLAALLHRILDMVTRAPNGKMEVSHQEVGRLDVLEQLPGAGDVLSKEVRAKWKVTSMPPASPTNTDGGDFDEKNESAENLHGSETPDDDDDGDDDDIDDDDDDSDVEEGGIVWDEKTSNDFTACSESCEYCGKCSY